MPVTPETRQAVQDAAEALRNAGFDVRPFRPQALEQARKLWELFFLRCGAMFEEPLVRGHEDKLSPVFRDFLARAHAAGPLTAEEVLTAWAEADIIRSKLLAQMQEFPLLLVSRALRCRRSVTTSEAGPSTDSKSSISTPCATRSGSTCWQRLPRSSRWAARPKGCRSVCRSSAVPSKMKSY